MGKRLIFFVVLLVLVVGLVELVSLLAFNVSSGESFSYAALDEARARAVAVAAGDAAGVGGDAGQGSKISVVVHPYLGYVCNPDIGTSGWIRKHGAGINKYGFCDSRSLIQPPSDDRVVVAITGGSVAHWVHLHAGEVLAAELQKALFPDKEVIPLAFAMGAFKQPQQLMTLNYVLALGGQVDILVNLDGLNELVAAGHRFHQGSHIIYPPRWDQLVANIPDLEYQRSIGKLVQDRDVRRKWAEAMGAGLLRYSVTAQLVWKLRDRRMASDISQSAQAVASYKPEVAPFVAVGPGIDELKESKEFKEGRGYFPAAAQIWKRCSIQLHRLCESNGIDYFHFLQPNQYVDGSKPMSDEERKVAIHASEKQNKRVAVEQGYPELLALAPEMETAGVCFGDLRWVFKDIEEPLYIDDCCHVNKEGSVRMAMAIAQEIIQKMR